MNTGNPALDAYLLYMTSKSAKGSLKRISNKYEYEKQTAERQVALRSKEAEKLAEQWNMYRTGNLNESKTQQLRSAAGIALSEATAFQRSMTNNYLLATAPKLAGRAVQGGVGLLNAAGLHNNLLNTIGAKAGGLASAASPLSTAFRYAQYVNPMYAATSIASNKIFGAIGGAIGNQFLGSMVAGPVAALMMPMITKITKSVINKVAGGGISKKYTSKLRPLSIDAKLHGAAEFIDKQPLQDANKLINQLRAGGGDHIDPIQVGQLNFLARIAAQTSSIPILTAEFVNNFIKKDSLPASRYNSNLKFNEQYYQGQSYSEAIEKHAHRMDHGKFAHTFTENVGLAATELSSWMNKMSILMDPIKQLQIVLSGGNINNEANKFGKSFKSVAQRNANIFAKALGIKGEESYAHMYFSLNESSQSILSKAKSFDDAQIGLLSGIYEFTRLTALETATLRTKAYGIKEPIKYNIVGKNDAQAKGLIEWLANKIPMFQLVRGTTSFISNSVHWLLEKSLGYDNKFFDFIGHSKFKNYHNGNYNRMARGFSYIDETTLTQRLVEPFIDKLNKSVLKIPFLRIFGNENRETLLEKSKKKYQSEMANAVEAAMKELGLNKLSDQAKYYKYATTSMPDQFDLMIHHLANISLFAHATMINTANLSQIVTGQGYIEKPLARRMRTVNAYTGKLETNKEHEIFMQSVFKNLVGKVKENAFESKTTLGRLSDALKFAVGKGSRTGNDEQQLQRGVLEALNYTFEKERNTAAEVWALESNSAYYNPLFSKDYLRKLKKDPRALKTALYGNKYANQLSESMRKNFGLASFSSTELSSLESNMLKVDVAKISAPEVSKILRFTKDKNIIDTEIVGSAVTHILTSQQGEDIVDAATKAFHEYKKSSKYKMSKDNSISDVLDARKHNEEDLEEIQTEKLGSIATAAETLVKEFKAGLPALIEKSAKKTSTSSPFNLFSDGKKLLSKLFSLVKNKIPLLGSLFGGLSSVGSFLISNPIGWAIDATAVAAGAGFGLYEGRYGREKYLIKQLDKAGIIDYNFFGHSEIKRWDIIEKLPLSQLTQLLSFDDWDDKTKKRLQQLVAAKTKQKVLADKQEKLVFKNEKQFNNFIKQRNANMRKKQGFFGYWGGEIMNNAKTVFETIMTGGGFITGYNPRLILFYQQLEDAGVISFSVLPFAKSEVRDWDTLLKLSPEQLKKLLKLNWDKKTEQRIKEIINIRTKQKYHVTGDVDKIIKSIKEHKIKFNKQKDYNLGKRNTVQLVSDKVSNLFGSNDVVDQLIRKGAIEHYIFGNSDITKKGWELISKLSPKQISQIIAYDDWDDDTKTRLIGLMQAKMKQGSSAPVAGNDTTIKSKTDIKDITSTPTTKISTAESLLVSLNEKLNTLIGVTANGHAEQVKVAIQTAKQLVEKHVDEIKSPIHDL